MIRASVISPLTCAATMTQSVRVGASDDMSLRFSLDTPEDQSTRQSVLIAALQGDETNRSVPDIPVVCVLTQ